MTHLHPPTKKWRVLSIPAWLGIVLALLATMLLPLALVAQATSATGQEPVLSSSTLRRGSGQALLRINSAEEPVLSQSKEPAGLDQFTAGGHVLGFQPDGVYVVGGDHMLKVTFVGASGVAPVADQPPSSDGLAQSLGQVTYRHLWEGISLTYQQVTGGIAESSYLLDPGATVDQIRLRYNVPVQVDAGGKLLFGFETGRMSESAPMAWQEIAGQRVPVAVSFRLLAEREVSFALGEYDPAYPLMIDPTLQWHTFMGSSDSDYGSGIAVDGSGNVYVTGTSYATWGSPVNPYAGDCDAFAAQLDSSGVRQWHTFMGSSDEDDGLAIAVDGSGNVYVTGSSTYTWGSPVNAHAGNEDAFAAKLDSSGVRQWHTFMGSSSYDGGWGIALDGSGNVYVAGYSDATWGSPVNPYAGGSDAFAAKLDSSGVRQWHTFMGSSDGDYGEGIAVDGSGNVYVVGGSDATWGSPVNSYAGGRDAFAAQLDSSGVWQWHTFMGSSSGWDYGYGIAVDGSGNVYVVGYSGATWGSPVNPHHAGSYDAFAAQLDSSGVRQWHTFMGSSDSDYGEGIAVDGSGNVYVTGTSLATWGSPVNAHVGWADAFVAKLGPLSISKTADPSTDVTYHGEVTYTVALNNSGAISATGTLLTDTLPGEVDFASWVEQPAGANQAGDVITWTGTVTAGEAITFTFVVSHVGDYSDVVTNTAEYSHLSSSDSDDATFTVEFAPIYLPIIMKNH